MLLNTGYFPLFASVGSGDSRDCLFHVIILYRGNRFSFHSIFAFLQHRIATPSCATMCCCSCGGLTFRMTIGDLPVYLFHAIPKPLSSNSRAHRIGRCCHKNTQSALKAVPTIPITVSALGLDEYVISKQNRVLQSWQQKPALLDQTTEVFHIKGSSSLSKFDTESLYQNQVFRNGWESTSSISPYVPL